MHSLSDTKQSPETVNAVRRCPIGGGHGPVGGTRISVHRVCQWGQLSDLVWVETIICLKLSDESLVDPTLLSFTFPTKNV